MNLADLPDPVKKMLLELNAPPRLLAHLQLVHDVAIKLCRLLDTTVPTLQYDQEAVLFGAASHDIGKALCPGELVAQGNLHEERGHELLLASGYPERLARFAFTHGGHRREPNPTLEDLLVRTADAIWKGSRHHNSEMELVKLISANIEIPEWQAYSIVDEILTQLAADAEERLSWQFLHSV